MPKSKTDFTNFVDARPNYFPGQFLLEDDFNVEQKYLIDRQKYHRQSLHVSGIVEGLEVEVITNKLEVQIKSGSGINSNGDLIILKKDTSFSQFAALTNGELYIRYNEKKEVEQQGDFTRWQEVPTIGFAATTPNDGVKLAKIFIVNNVPNLDLTVRDYSGIFLPNATGNDLTLRSGGKENPNVAILNGSLTVKGTGTSSFAGDLRVTGTITGKIDAVNINSGVLDAARIADNSLSSDKIISLSANKITAGTTTGNLTIGGNLRVTGSLTADNKITVPGNQKIKFTDTDDTNNLKLELWTGYGLGINPNTLFYAAYSKHSWRDSDGGERMVLTTGADGCLTVMGTGISSFAGDLKVTGKSSFGGNLDVVGNVGIGTTNPTTKLEVNGDLKVNGQITTKESMTIGRNLVVHSMSILQGSLQVTGPCDFLNNVSIGTALESRKLEVNGNLRVKTITLVGGINNNSVTMSVDNTGLILTVVNSTFGTNKKIKWDGDNNWDQL